MTSNQVTKNWTGDYSSPKPVGGEMLPIDKLSVFLSQYGLFLLILLMPLAYVVYKKRTAFLAPLTHLAFWRLLR